MNETYMQRCIDLAILGAGSVAPNPMVGAVLVYDNRIIGEGWHKKYGGPHAEVNCFDSVSEADKPLIAEATLYVSLEPCAHFGKTPPCADLVIKNNIPKVVIGCRDPFTEVDGKGIEKLENAGIEVINCVLEKQCIELNKRFFIFHTQQRPYIILKWAETADAKIAANTNERLLISNEYTNRLVHQWRSEEAAILIGTNTALSDDPSLTNRLWEGNDPVRMVLDKELRLPLYLKLFDQQQKTIVFNFIKQEENKNIIYQKINRQENIIQQILNASYRLGLQSILVEGGAQLLQSFIDTGIWDEARIICNEEMTITNGLNAPSLNRQPVRKEKILSDTIFYYTNKP